MEFLMAVLKIYGDIGESLPEDAMGEGAQSISSKDVLQFLEDNKDATDITVRINSRGGDVQEGWAIFDLLQNSGKKIKTIGEGKIYSIATIIFLAGDEREIMKNADGLIHNPFIPPYTLADAYQSTDLLKIAEGLAQEEEKILNFYADETGADKAKLAEYMSADTKLSAEDMLALGFATKIIEPIKAYAIYKPINILNMNEKEVKSFGEKLDLIIDKVKNFSRLSTKDQTLTDKDGKELKLEKETGAPAIGDKATPDGTFEMTSGQVITVAAGAITDIKEPVAAKTELEIANEKIAELEAKVALSEIAKAEAETAKLALQEETVKAVAFVAELSALKNTWKPDTRSQSFTNTEKVGDIDLSRVKEILTNKNK